MGALGAVPLTLAQVTGEPKTLHCRLPHTAAAAAAAAADIATNSGKDRHGGPGRYSRFD